MGRGGEMNTKTKRKKKKERRRRRRRRPCQVDPSFEGKTCCAPSRRQTKGNYSHWAAAYMGAALWTAAVVAYKYIYDRCSSWCIQNRTTMDSNGYEKKRERARAREKKHIDIGTVRQCAYVHLCLYIYRERKSEKRKRDENLHFALPSDTLTH